MFIIAYPYTYSLIIGCFQFPQKGIWIRLALLGYISFDLSFSQSCLTAVSRGEEEGKEAAKKTEEAIAMICAGVYPPWN